MKCKVIAAIFTLLTAIALSHPAEARHHRTGHHHYARIATQTPADCLSDNSGHITCSGAIGPTGGHSYGSYIPPEKRRYAAIDANGNRSGVRYIPNPPGTWRVNLSCAHRLAAYWGLGHGLDAVDTWPHRFAHASGPCIGCAAYRSGHIMGIIGGGPGAWVVADFNSGEHLNREYTISHFPGYYHFLAVHSG